MGGSESTAGEYIANQQQRLNELETKLNIKEFYKLVELVEPNIINILTDYKFKIEYDLIHSNNGDNIFIDKIFKYQYGTANISIYGNDIYKTEHSEYSFDNNGEEITSLPKIYDTYEHWKQFRTGETLTDDYAKIPNDLYWSITDINVDKSYSWYDIFAMKYETDRKNMRSSYNANTQLKTYSDIITNISENTTALTYNDTLNADIIVVSGDLEAKQTQYNNIYSNLIFHSYNDLIKAGQTYYKDTKYKYDLYNKGLMGLLEYYIDLCKSKHMIYTTIPDDYKNTFNKILYDTATERPLGNIPEDFKPTENKYVKSVLANRFNSNEKQQLKTVFKLAWKNNYIRLINTYLQICSLVMDKSTYDKYFNTSNGYIKTLTDKEISAKYPTLINPDYLIDEETSIDNNYVYGILSRRVFLPVSSLKIIKNNKLLTFNANRREIQLKEYYIIQLIKWLINATTDAIKLADGWTVSLSDDLGSSRDEIINELYLNDYSKAIKSINDIGQPFVESSFEQDFITKREQFNNDYNNLINAYIFCNRDDVNKEFRTYPNKTTEPITDKIIKLKTLLQQQTDNNYIKEGIFPIDYYAYRIIMLINGVNGWQVFNDILNKETYLISYVLYYYTKKYEKWISKYLSYKGFTTYYNQYMAMFHNDSQTQYSGDVVAMFDDEPDIRYDTSFTMRTDKMFNFLLSPEMRTKINPNYGGTIGNIFNKWALLSQCMDCYNGVYRKYYDCLTYIINHYGKWLNLLFTDYIPSQTEDKNDIKKLPLLQETNASMKTIPNYLCSYLFDINSGTANKKKILKFIDDYSDEAYKADSYIVSLLYNIIQSNEQINISFSLDGNYGDANINIKLNNDVNINGFDKKNITLKNVGSLIDIIQRCWILNPSDVTMPVISKEYKEITNKYINGEINYKQYEEYVKSIYINICPFDNMTGIYKICSGLIPNIKILMTVSYFLLYRFASSEFNQSVDIGSQQLPTNKCYNDFNQLINEALTKNINGGWSVIENDYNTILNKNYKYGYFNGETVTLSGLISLYMFAFNCKISHLYNNVVRTYYEKYFDMNTFNKLISSNKSTLENSVSVIQHGIIENDKTANRNK